MGGSEIVLIIFVALLFFGSKAIPDIAKTLGKAMREFQKATNEIKREINDAGGLGDEIKDLRSTIQGAKSDIEKGIKTHTSEIDHDIKEIKHDLEEGIKTQTDEIDQEIKEIKHDLKEGIKTQTDEIDQEMKEMKTDIKEMKTDISQGTEDIVHTIDEEAKMD